ncbi:hypothetical protein HPB49_010578 [Dermacentor silvarum]|uniref:Uncharacterized protein n=1 Tax=Dermacentor silvarum TaxID=543639 RepID=A0ACB8CEJ8_DERSI|nr:hypothetical protein HPB49_010578 [Dermacentor silvarum]
MGVEMRCTEYRPTIQMCLECMQEGHRSDVCPNPKNICRGCGLGNPPPQGHECEVKCAVCRAAGHETRRCPNKLIAAKRGKTTRPSRSRERSGQNTKKAPGRWFESTEEEDLYRRRSRSRSPHGSRAISNTPSRDPSSSRASQRSNSPLPKKQQVLRLSCTPAGRKILDEMGLYPVHQCPDAVWIPSDIRSQIHIAPIPRNMHPAHNVGRRRARATSMRTKRFRLKHYSTYLPDMIADASFRPSISRIISSRSLPMPVESASHWSFPSTSPRCETSPP